MGSNNSTSSSSKSKSRSKNKNNSNKKKELKNDIDLIQIKRKNIKEDDLCPIKFIWKEEGKNVLLTGSFVDWNKFYTMELNKETNTFEKTLILPLEDHKFIYKVDGTWKTSKDYQTTREKRKWVNIIYKENISDKSLKNKNNCSFSPSDKETRESIHSPSPLSPRSPTESENKEEGMFTKYIESPKINTPNNIDSHKLSPKRGIGPKGPLLIKNYYGNYFPSKREMNADAPQAPLYYTLKYHIDFYTNQHILKTAKQEYLKLSERNNLSENNSYKDIYLAPHVNM
ncbi:MAG: hypothetical protein MJ252_07930 [archaeon]|nr:hypothetical protein [archaeon]